MKYAVDKQERHTVFTVQEGNLNSVVAPELKSEFVLLSNEGIRNLIVDLSQVEYIDSSGLSSILTANRLWKDLGSFILTGEMQPNVKRLITMSRLDSVLTIIPTVAESIDFAYMEELQRDLTKED
jgi:anti-anti-sigma factor